MERTLTGRQAQFHVANGNVLTRALPMEELVSIRHYEVASLHSRAGPLLTPAKLQQFQYFVVTDSHLHIVDRTGAAPGVVSIPLLEIDALERDTSTPELFKQDRLNSAAQRVYVVRARPPGAAAQEAAAAAERRKAARTACLGGGGGPRQTAPHPADDPALRPLAAAADGPAPGAAASDASSGLAVRDLSPPAQPRCFGFCGLGRPGATRPMPASAAPYAVLDGPGAGAGGPAAGSAGGAAWGLAPATARAPAAGAAFTGAGDYAAPAGGAPNPAAQAQPGGVTSLARRHLSAEQRGTTVAAPAPLVAAAPARSWALAGSPAQQLQLPPPPPPPQQQQQQPLRVQYYAGPGPLTEAAASVVPMRFLDAGAAGAVSASAGPGPRGEPLRQLHARLQAEGRLAPASHDAVDATTPRDACDGGWGTPGAARPHAWGGERGRDEATALGHEGASPSGRPGPITEAVADPWAASSASLLGPQPSASPHPRSEPHAVPGAGGLFSAGRFSAAGAAGAAGGAGGRVLGFGGARGGPGGRGGRGPGALGSFTPLQTPGLWHRAVQGSSMLSPEELQRAASAAATSLHQQQQASPGHMPTSLLLPGGAGLAGLAGEPSPGAHAPAPRARLSLADAVLAAREELLKEELLLVTVEDPSLLFFHLHQAWMQVRAAAAGGALLTRRPGATLHFNTARFFFATTVERQTYRAGSAPTAAAHDPLRASRDQGSLSPGGAGGAGGPASAFGSRPLPPSALDGHPGWERYPVSLRPALAGLGSPPPRLPPRTGLFEDRPAEGGAFAAEEEEEEEGAPPTARLRERPPLRATSPHGRPPPPGAPTQQHRPRREPSRGISPPLSAAARPSRHGPPSAASPRRGLGSPAPALPPPTTERFAVPRSTVLRALFGRWEHALLKPFDVFCEGHLRAVEALASAVTYAPDRWDADQLLKWFFGAPALVAATTRAMVGWARVAAAESPRDLAFGAWSRMVEGYNLAGYASAMRPRGLNGWERLVFELMRRQSLRKGLRLLNAMAKLLPGSEAVDARVLMLTPHRGGPGGGGGDAPFSDFLHAALSIHPFILPESTPYNEPNWVRASWDKGVAAAMAVGGARLDDQATDCLVSFLYEMHALGQQARVAGVVPETSYVETVLARAAPKHRRAQACAIFSRLVGLLVAVQGEAGYLLAYRAAFVLLLLLRAAPAEVAADINAQYAEEIQYVLSKPTVLVRLRGRASAAGGGGLLGGGGFFASRALHLYKEVIDRVRGQPLANDRAYGPILF